MKGSITKEASGKNSIGILWGILFITIAVFLSFTLIGFHPEDSLYFNSQLAEQVHHFLGKFGVTVSSFLFYYLGRSTILFSFFIFYFGYALLRKIKAIKKSGLILLAFAAFILSFIFFSGSGDKELYKSGGLIGKSLYMILKKNIKGDVLFILSITAFVGTMTILLKYPFSRIAQFITRIKGTKNGYVSKEMNKKKRMDTISVHEDQVIDTKIHSYTGMKRNRKSRREKGKIRKPPLIQKVYLDDEIKREPEKIIHKTKKEVKGEYQTQVEQNMELDTGQYLLSESSTIEDIHFSEKARMGNLPDISILKKSKPFNRKERDKETVRKARELERTLSEFGINARVIGIIRGPVITRYELQPAPGVKLSRIVNLSDNIALSLSANGVRIEAPIPGRSAVGIEIPNEEREIVTLGDIISDARIYGELPLILGKDISGKVIVSDLIIMPHLLIAGATGSGKSVCVNSLIMSLLFHKKPEEVRFLMIDPKMVELKIYNGIPHLLTEVVTDPRDATKALRWLIYEMENRYKLLDENFVRDITGYNRKVREKMPYIIIIIDEFANLMAISQKEVEDVVVRLAAMSRAVGIHLIMATQRPSVDVITGLIKANFPYRIAFQVASKTDSRTILDSIGAEKLLGRGDMLFSPAGSMNIKRIQGAYILEEEVLKIVNDLKKNYNPDYRDDIFSLESNERYEIDDNDPIFDNAVDVVLKTKRASASFLQRRLKIGYNRAARLIELMEEKGIIGPPRGSKPREIYIDSIE